MKSKYFKRLDDYSFPGVSLLIRVMKREVDFGDGGGEKSLN